MLLVLLVLCETNNMSNSIIFNLKADQNRYGESNLNATPGLSLLTTFTCTLLSFSASRSNTSDRAWLADSHWSGLPSGIAIFFSLG